MANITQVSRAGKELAVLVERDRHDAISREKGFFHSVAVMNVNVDIHYTLVSTAHG